MKITADSHTDHRLTPEHLAWLCERFAGRTGFFIEEALLPGRLPSVECGLHGPKAGDAPVLEEEVTYVVCGERAGESRMCKRPPRLTRTITVIAGPHGEEPCILYTAYGGPNAPREPFDPSLDEKSKRESEAFWSAHALSLEGE
jgi:hypothetical protein